MTIKELIEKRRRQHRDIVEKNIPLQRAVLTTVSRQAERIFVGGQNSAGQTFQYDTSAPLYVNPNKAPRKGGSKPKGIQGLLPTKGKTGQHKFKNGKEHKTTYLNNYKEFQNRIGRPIDKVHYFHTGELASDFRSGNPKKISSNEYHVTLKRPGNIDKLSGLQSKYGNITPLMASEKEKFLEILDKEFKLILQ